MAVRKAVLVNSENSTELQGRFDMGGWEPEDLEGLYLVAAFGSTSDWNLLSKAGLESTYTRTGKDLENGFFEVEHK